MSLPRGKCPQCGKPIGAEALPFCSRRCKLLDLHQWLRGDYRIPGPPVGEGDSPRGQAKDFE